ncbi:interleukin-9 receptor-like [Sceloporus undulatus]|uniref:interleukin-9 receptor-like n=1 Tax=Sceloporus undulatus TaxID=8520 RepID=UPI001C4D2AD8|nr:interleukin-9 receptor-like [Sceloporus undulatus]
MSRSRFHVVLVPGEPPLFLCICCSPTGTLICLLSASPDAQDHYSCSVEEKGEFTENDDYRVSLHTANTSPGKNMTYPVFTSYEPRLHILCDPPTGLQSNASASKWWIQWRKPESYEDINLEDWHWQLAFKAAGEPWEQAKAKNFVSQDSWVEIDGFEFKGGVDYVARVRCKIPEENNVYHSHWSAWSSTTSWTGPPGDDAGQKQLDPHLLRALHTLLPLCLGALMILLLAFFWRMKDMGRAYIPTPATFFQPLYASHNGDFKGWAGLKGKAVCLNRALEEDAPGSGHGDKGHAVAAPDSRITFLTSPLKVEAVPQEESYPRGGPTGAEAEALGTEQVQEPQSSGRQGSEPQFLPQGVPLQDPRGPMAAEEKKKEAPLSLPSFPEPGPLWEREALFSCSNDYYCMWGGAVAPGP